ncbi:hypothetical protein Bca52824_014133 [Brassica carinata]|uniref:Uncharacterized protein n=1 Tax=Brassica carinata TaxID=52824 RepID=A0A8X8B350_BRACI|nr:hypothetical protein Bca52824_014133 [Brassica carinata]
MFTTLYSSFHVEVGVNDDGNITLNHVLWLCPWITDGLSESNYKGVLWEADCTESFLKQSNLKGHMKALMQDQRHGKHAMRILSRSRSRIWRALYNLQCFKYLTDAYFLSRTPFMLALRRAEEYSAQQVQGFIVFLSSTFIALLAEQVTVTSPDRIEAYFNQSFDVINPLFHLSSIQSTSSSPLVTVESSDYKSPISSDEQRSFNQIEKNNFVPPTSSFLIGVQVIEVKKGGERMAVYIIIEKFRTFLMFCGMNIKFD